MARIFINQTITPEDIEKSSTVWSEKNGAKRHHITLIIKTKNISNISTDNPSSINTIIDNSKIGWYSDSNESIIVIGDNLPPLCSIIEEDTVGIFLNNHCGYTMIYGDELFSKSSVGGYGNSESKFGVYTPHTIIQEHTYKHRAPAGYYMLIPLIGTISDIMSSDDPLAHKVLETIKDYKAVDGQPIAPFLLIIIFLHICIL